MVHSMTAFARVERSGAFGTLCWELRSINSRYLEPHLRLPDTLRELEGSTREALRQKLSRGKIECTLRHVEAESSQRLHVDELRTRDLLHAVAQVSALMSNPASLNPLDVLRWPGVLVSAGSDAQQLLNEARAAFNDALAQLQDGRAREGAELARLIEERLTHMDEQVEQLRALLPELLAHQRQKIHTRCAELQVELDPQRLEQEMVLLAQKSDVAEELDRLQTHLNEVRRVLKAGGSAGRRLDFLMQELNREANTLGSKAFDTRSTQVAVTLKVLIEQMREQVQNIE